MLQGGKDMKKTVNALIIGFTILMVLVFTGCSSTANIGNLLKDDKNEQAIDEYNKTESASNDTTKLLYEKLDEIYDRFKNKSIDYDTAKSMAITFSNAKDSGVYEASNKITSKIDELNKSRVAFETAQSLENEKKYQEAINQYSLVIEDDENYDTATQRLKECQNNISNEAIQSAESSFNNGDYSDALSTLNNAHNILPNDEKISHLISAYSETFVNEIISKTDTLIADGNLDEAVSTLYDSLKILPRSETLKNKLNEIDGLKPVGLETVHVIDSKSFRYLSGGFTDSFGNSYVDCHSFYAGSIGKCYAIYNLNGEYKTLKGSIAASERHSSTASTTIIISADGNQLYKKTGIQKTTEITDFEVNVEHCSQLEIRVESEKGDRRVGIVNAVLNKV